MDAPSGLFDKFNFARLIDFCSFVFDAIIEFSYQVLNFALMPVTTAIRHVLASLPNSNIIKILLDTDLVPFLDGDQSFIGALDLLGFGNHSLLVLFLGGGIILYFLYQFFVWILNLIT